MKSSFVIAASLVLFASQSFAAAHIAMLGQDRRATSSVFVAAQGEFDDQQFTEVAPDGGPFSADVVATAGIATGTGSAQAVQMSQLNTAFLHANGTVMASSTTLDDETQAYAFAQSNVALRFDISEPTTFALTGFVEGDALGNVTVQLSRPFQTVVWADADGQHLDLMESGTLEADTYDLNITCSANGNNFDVGSASGLAEYSVHFAINSGATDAPVIAGEALAAYPNPFRASTRLTVPAGFRAVRILDAAGRVVRTLTGSEAVLFDGRDAAGSPLASGVYWAQPVGTDLGEAVKLVRLR